jgi:tol-pal system protein YbgF
MSEKTIGIMGAMQEEIQELRGLVEQQSNELKRLKQQREDDYLDLDRRLSAMGKGGASTSKSAEDSLESDTAEKKIPKNEPQHPRSQSPSLVSDDADGKADAATAPISAGNSASSASASDEYSTYSSALNLIVKEKNYDQGIGAMTKYLAQYPKGKYAPNAYFWMASAYQTQNRPDKSIETFEKMVKRYPKEPKADEARVRLARVYLQRGDKDEAKLMLDEVVEAGGPQAKSAQDLLQRNF